MSQFSRRRLLRDGGWLLAGHLLAAVGTLVGIRLLTEVLDPAAYGTVALLIGLISLHNSLFPVQAGKAVSRFWPGMESGTHGSLQLEAERLLRVDLAIASALLALGIVVEGLVVGRTAATIGLLSLTVVGLLAAEGLQATEMAAAVAQRRSRLVAFWHAANWWLRPLLAVGLVVLIPAHAVAAVLAGYALATGGLALAVRRAQRQPGLPDAGLRRRVLRFAAPLMPLAVVGWVNGLADRYLISVLVDLQSVGLYAAVYGLAGRPMLIIGGVTTETFRPAYFAAMARRDYLQAQRLLRTWMALLSATLLAAVLAFALLSDLVVSLLLAEEYRSAAWLLPLLAVAHVPLLMSQALGSVSLAHDRPQNLTFAESAGAVATIVLAAPLLIALGLAGGALATLAAFSVQCGVAWRLAARAAVRSRPAPPEPRASGPPS